MSVSILARPGALVRLAGRRLDLSRLVWVVAAAVLTLMVLVPLAWIVLASLQSDATQRWTLSNYADAFLTTRYLAPIRNTAILATSAALCAVVSGTVLAWAIGRTDMPGRAVLRALVFAAFVTPPFLGATAWIFLAAPNSGWLNRGWVALTGAERGWLDIYSLPGAIFVISLYSYPYTFAFVSSALEALPSDMERAAALLGAGWVRRTLRITLPMVRPAVIAGALMSLLEALAEFGTPAFLLIPARQQVMTTQLYLFFQYPSRPNLAAAYAVPLLAVAVGLFLVQQRLLKKGRFTTIGGKGGDRSPIRLGAWRWPLLLLCCVPPTLSLVLPYGALLATSLSRVWAKGPVAGNLTLEWYGWALYGNPAARAAISHSLTYAAAAATIATVLALFTAYVAARGLLPAAHLLGFVAKAPFIAPGIVLAIGFFSAYARPPLVLYGTAWMLIVAFATRFLPIAYVGTEAALQTIDRDLELAARTLGSNQLGALRRVTLPLLRRAVLANWLLVFIPSLRELSSAIFLFTPATAVMSTLIFDLSDAGNFEPVSALGVVLMLLTFTLVGLAYRFFGGAAIGQRRAELPTQPPA
ncbi:MAG TPA: iron ABC transporter permease [Chloroflexota bacterium]|nr:iron ABC transporter permease [Chloroflexota bacterium]